MASTKTHNVTYLGRRAKVTEVREGGPASKRTVRTEWIDDADAKNGGYPAGTITERTIQGDFRKGTGEVLVPNHVIKEA